MEQQEKEAAKTQEMKPEQEEETLNSKKQQEEEKLLSKNEDLLLPVVKNEVGSSLDLPKVEGSNLELKREVQVKEDELKLEMEVGKVNSELLVEKSENLLLVNEEEKERLGKECNDNELELVEEAVGVAGDEVEDGKEKGFDDFKHGDDAQSEQGVDSGKVENGLQLDAPDDVAARGEDVDMVDVGTGGVGLEEVRGGDDKMEDENEVNANTEVLEAEAEVNDNAKDGEVERDSEDMEVETKTDANAISKEMEAEGDANLDDVKVKTEANANTGDMDAGKAANANKEDVDAGKEGNACMEGAEDEREANASTEDVKAETEATADKEDVEAEGEANARMEDADANADTENVQADGDANASMEDADANAGTEDVEAEGEANSSTEDADANAHTEDVEHETEANADMEDETEEANDVDMSKGKRKRGKTQLKAKQTPQSQRKKKEEEDVCFICFDGGSIVLCDKRGCPKAYHPACIKRDESFFDAKSKWNCDWHICSSCQKASHYMCFTCVFSLCKGCTKDTDFVRVRGNKGICGSCMKTIALIENIAPVNTELGQVDFDDKTSWEYLFKDYWIDLKAKLSLTVDEITKAKSPWKGDEQPKSKNSGKGTGGAASCKEPSDDENLDSGGNVGSNRPKRRKIKNQAKALKKQNSLLLEDSDVDEPCTEEKPWATKELLEFVAHMRGGDTTVVSQFDVQALLAEYIKKNNLRDPRQKSQIICDSRLKNLFGQPRVGHFEMLKLLENHFLIKEKSTGDDSPRGVSDDAGSDGEGAGSSDSRSDRKRKARKKANGKRSLRNPNSEEYAAIDDHNINLLFLKRNVMENLMDDIDKFPEMVVGSFVRIRISGGDQKQNMYRLVPVVGTSKVDESYKVGSRTTDIMLEILNLNKKETVSIDGISNQEFLEDECRRLRQSIKCGLVKPLKVGEIQEKAMALQPVKVNDWLRSEITRLDHLRDRASDTGRRKELRECVEKIDLLKSPKERQRRLNEIPDVHVDPKMDPSYESDEDAGDVEERKREFMRSRSSSFGRRHLERNSSFRESDQNNAGRHFGTASEQGQNISAPHYAERESRWGSFALNNQNKNQPSPTGLATHDWSSRATIQPESHSHSTVASAMLPSPHSSVKTALPSPLSSVKTVLPSPHASAREVSHADLETEKMWHYVDPAGNVQGPFSIFQLRKWSSKGHFPPHFRVWRTNEKQENSILLVDVLDGRFPRRL